MSPERPTEQMEQLLARLREAVGALADGRLDEAGLEDAAGDARAFYERLVVLRHKYRERQVQPPEAHAQELPAMRLDTRPAEAPPRQTSLIDAIAESERTEEPPPAAAPVAPPAPAAPAPRPAAPSLSERMEHAPVKDLHKAIALSQKFWFVAELFDGQRDRYEKAVDALNACRTLVDALALLETEVLAKARRKPDPEAVKAMQDLLERRYP